MQFWGVEVKNGDSLKVEPGKDMILHISQACIGDIKKDKGNECFRLFAQMDGQKFVIGILSPEKFPHVNLDLVFEDDFVLSHDGKQGSVHFAGYKIQDPSESISEDESDDDLEETVPVGALNNGKPESKSSKANASGVKPEKAEGKPKVKIVEPNKDAKDEDDDDTEDDECEDDDEDDEDDDDEDMPSAEVGSDEDDSDEEEDSDEEDDSEEAESDEETLDKKPAASKKRPGESTSKTPGAEKKAKFSTPEKMADGKKSSGHVATPHPAKVAKTPANAGKSDKQASKSGGTVTCTSCKRSFGSQQALDSHSKAKHGTM